MTGQIVFFADEAKQYKNTILTRIETSPEDIKGMNASEGILTAKGGMTSHAALVARQMGKVCVAGCGTLEIDYKKLFEDNNMPIDIDYLQIDIEPAHNTLECLKKIPFNKYNFSNKNV